MERVGFYVRAGASLVDLFLLALVVHGAMLVDALLNREYDVVAFGTITWGATAAMVVLGFALEVLGSGTVGKRVLGLAIGGEDGQPAPPGARLRRAMMKFAPTVLVFFPVLALAPTFSGNPYSLREVQLDGLRVLGAVDLAVWAAVGAFVITGCFKVLNPDRQAFHDRFAGTAVFRRRDLAGQRAFGFIPLAKRADQAAPPAPGTPPELPAAAMPPVDEERPDGVL